MALAYLTQDAWPLFLLSLMVSFAAFPLVVLCSIVYGYLVSKHARAPKLLLVWLVTMFGTLLAVFLFYAYLDASLAQLLKSF